MNGKADTEGQQRKRRGKVLRAKKRGAGFGKARGCHYRRIAGCDKNTKLAGGISEGCKEQRCSGVFYSARVEKTDP